MELFPRQVRFCAKQFPLPGSGSSRPIAIAPFSSSRTMRACSGSRIASSTSKAALSRATTALTFPFRQGPPRSRHFEDVQGWAGTSPACSPSSNGTRRPATCLCISTMIKKPRRKPSHFGSYCQRLGLYDSKGKLHHVSFTSAIKLKESPLTKQLEAMTTEHDKSALHAASCRLKSATDQEQTW